MNWKPLCSELAKLPLPKQNLSCYTCYRFLKPSEYHAEKYAQKEVLVVAEEEDSISVGISCLVIDIEGNVYTADLHTYEIYQYCNQSFAQFLKIAEKFIAMDGYPSPSVFDEQGQKDLQKREQEFRCFIMQIDPSALSNENYFWSLCAEEMGYGFYGK